MRSLLKSPSLKGKIGLLFCITSTYQSDCYQSDWHVNITDFGCNKTQEDLIYFYCIIIGLLCVWTHVVIFHYISLSILKHPVKQVKSALSIVFLIHYHSSSLYSYFQGICKFPGFLIFYSLPFSYNSMNISSSPLFMYLLRKDSRSHSMAKNY